MKLLIAGCLLMSMVMGAIQCAAPTVERQLENAQQEAQEQLESKLNAN